ncbi:uncharacterized protein GGS25DRAFT_157660 [Hypoxylon fragiforme]|uniref:uncharacterized protein n=1 Tax=Hypoxylon fragiforme TaxID=63214 RepID=UPI0020C5F341|nr:uncharacterized protein GGS25DRAFT_157660 [Hypoxylon fragiforme]KAI2610659.1 hypothetical protein GGS25DRAFT_157660 [Hypoxylon fragiforme]
MSQVTIRSNQVSGQSQQTGSTETMKSYLYSGPSTATERLVQGNIMSDQDITDRVRRVQLQLEILVRQAKGQDPQPS